MTQETVSRQARKDASVDTLDLVCLIDASTQTELTYLEAQEGHNEAEVTQPNTPNNGYNLDATTIIIPEDEYYDSDATRLDSPANPGTHDVIDNSDATTILEDQYDSDVTRLDTPTKADKHDLELESDTSSDGSYIETYTSDPSYTGPAYQSQPCGKHGASYTPPGWKRILIKRKKLFLCSGESDTNENNHGQN